MSPPVRCLSCVRDRLRLRLVWAALGGLILLLLLLLTLSEQALQLPAHLIPAGRAWTAGLHILARQVRGRPVRRARLVLVQCRLPDGHERLRTSPIKNLRLASGGATYVMNVN